MLRFRIGLAAAALLLLSSLATSHLRRSPDEGLLPIEPPTPFIHYANAGSRRGSALVVHGLDSNKEFMNVFSLALADSGYDVVSIDLPGHGDSTVAFNAVLARNAVANALAYLRTKSGSGDFVAVGHSLGAGFLLDVVNDTPIPSLVLFSPPPTPILTVRADRTLIVTGDLDIPAINAFIPQLVDVGQPNVEWRQLKWAAHSSPLFRPKAIESVVAWLDGPSAQNISTQTGIRLMWLGLQTMAAIILFLIIFAGDALPILPQSIPPTFVSYTAACTLAVVILKFVTPLSFLRLFTTDYLLSFLLIAGFALGATLDYRISRERASASVRALAAAGYVIGCGLLIGSNLIHMTLSTGRLWRFPIIAAASFPLFYADEIRIRRMGSWWKAGTSAFLTRTLIVASLVTGGLILNRQDAFLVLISYPLLLFWMTLWLVTGIVHRHTRDPLAAALFAALVQGWMFAAWFVIV